MNKHEDTIGPGAVVRHRLWDCGGTVVRRAGDALFVAWHGSCVEDEVQINDVELWPDAPPELAAWRGGVMEVHGDTAEVRPLRPELDLEWREEEPSKWVTRQVPCRPLGSTADVPDYFLGHILETEDGAPWLVDYHGSVITPPPDAVSEGHADSVAEARKEVAKAIYDLLAI